jgi:hypothetical protein
MSEKSEGANKIPSATELAALTQLSNSGSPCRLAGFLIREDEDAIYVADPQGTWMLPRESYESLAEWEGGTTAPASWLAMGKPVVAVLKEGALIHEIHPYRIQKGGDPLEVRMRRQALQKIFSLEGGSLPTTERTIIGERQLALLEELMGRRLGWDSTRDINSQVFSEHHPRSGSWRCESDGGVT